MPVPLESNSSVHPQPGRAVVPILALASMLGILNQASLGPFMVEISRELETSAPVLGQITALVFLGSTAVALFVGPLGDQYGKKRLIVLGLAVVALSTFSTMFAPSYGWLLASRLLSAVSGGLIAGSTMAVAGTLFTGAARRRALGSIASGIAVAPIIGIPVLTVIASLSSWRMSYGALSIMAGVWTLLAYRLLVDDSTRESGRIEVRKILEAYRPLLGQRSMLLLYGSTLLRAIGWVGMLTYIGAYLGEELDLTVRGIGWAMMAAGFGYFLGTKLSGGGLVGNFELRTLYGTSTGICALFLGSSMILPLGPLPAIALLTVGAFGGGVGFVALLALISSETTAGQGTTMSLNNAMFTLGAALGAFLGGLLLAAGSFSTLGAGLMGFTLSASLLVWHPARVWFPLRVRQPPGSNTVTVQPAEVMLQTDAGSQIAVPRPNDASSG